MNLKKDVCRIILGKISSKASISHKLSQEIQATTKDEGRKKGKHGRREIKRNGT